MPFLGRSAGHRNSCLYSDVWRMIPLTHGRDAPSAIGSSGKEKYTKYTCALDRCCALHYLACVPGMFRTACRCGRHPPRGRFVQARDAIRRQVEPAFEWSTSAENAGITYEEAWLPSRIFNIQEIRRISRCGNATQLFPLQLEETDLFRTPLSPCIRCTSPTDPLGWLERLCRSSPLSGKTGLIAVIFRGVGERRSVVG